MYGPGQGTTTVGAYSLTTDLSHPLLGTNQKTHHPFVFFPQPLKIISVQSLMTVVITPPPSLCAPILTQLPPQRRPHNAALRRHYETGGCRYSTPPPLSPPLPPPPPPCCAVLVMSRCLTFRLGDHAEKSFPPASSQLLIKTDNSC